MCDFREGLFVPQEVATIEYEEAADARYLATLVAKWIQDHPGRRIVSSTHMQNLNYYKADSHIKRLFLVTWDADADQDDHFYAPSGSGSMIIIHEAA